MLSNHLQPFLTHWRRMNPKLSTEEIRQALTKAGWTEAEIAEGLQFLAQTETAKESIPQPVQPVIKPSYHQPEKHHIYKPITAIVITTVVLFSSYAFIQAKSGGNFSQIYDDISKFTENLIPDSDTEPEQSAEQFSPAPQLKTLEERLAEEEQAKSSSGSAESTQTSVSVPRTTPARTTQASKQTTTQTTGQNFANVPPATTSTGGLGGSPDTPTVTTETTTESPNTTPPEGTETTTTETTTESVVEEAEEEHNFSFTFSDSGEILELNWSNEENSWKRVVRGITNSYLHSNSLYAYGWSYSVDGGPTVSEDKSSLVFSKEFEDEDTVILVTEGQAFKVRDILTFLGDSITIKSELENKIGKDVKVSVPYLLGGLKLDFNDKIRRLRGYAGGWIEEEFTVSGNYYDYPDGVSTYSPVSAMWDDDFAVGLQYLTEIRLPDNVRFYDRPVNWRGENNEQILGSTLYTSLGGSEKRTFELKYKLAASGDWQSALQPYKDWFYQNYGSEVNYCPASALSFVVGGNSRKFNGLYDDGSPYPWWSEVHEDNRYQPGTTLMEVIAPANTLEVLKKIGLQHHGIWKTSMYSTYLTGDSSRLEFNPNIDLLDPNLDAGIDHSKINDAVNTLNENGQGLFWFARPCANIYGADISIGTDGTYELTKGTPSGYRDVDLRSAENRDEYFRKMDFLVSRGVEGFYLDAMSCPGDEEFIDYTKQEFNKKYGKEIFIVKEGARDRDSLKWPQIPLVKFSGSAGPYVLDDSLLIDFLVPQGTYYVGAINQGLTIDEAEVFIDKGFQPVVPYYVSNSYFEDVSRLRSLMEKARQNQVDRDISSCPTIPPLDFIMEHKSAGENSSLATIAKSEMITIFQKPINFLGSFFGAIVDFFVSLF